MKTDAANWEEGLKAYGAALAEDGRIVRNGRTLGVRVLEKKGRLRFESVDGQLLSSGPVEAHTVERFVERFWFWRKA